VKARGIDQAKMVEQLQRRRQHGHAICVFPYFPSDFTMTARLSSWFASAAQLREMFRSVLDRGAEILGLAPRVLYSAAYVLHCSTEGIWALPPDPIASRV
jgi:hypothetical protein